MIVVANKIGNRPESVNFETYDIDLVVQPLGDNGAYKLLDIAK